MFKRSVCFIIALILSMTLTMSCVFAQSPQVVETAMEATANTTQPALTDAQIKTFVPENANVDVQRVALTGKKMSEAVIAYWVFESEPDGSAKPNAGTIVLQFNEDNQLWEKIWERKDEDAFHMEILDSGKLFNDETEQVALGSWEGSGAFLNFYLLGKDENGKIAVLMDKMNEEDGYLFGGLKIKDGDLWVSSASQGTCFHWNGKKFEESQFIDNPDINLAGDEDVIIHYSIDDDGNMTASYPNHAVIKIEPHDRIFFVRDNYNEKVERILYSGNGTIDVDLSKHYKVYEALAPGKTSIDIIPNGYDWDKSYTYEIKVIGSESNEQTSGSDAAEERAQTIQVNFDKVHVKVNDQDIKTKTILYNGTTYVPIREAAEMLGKDVIWNSDTFTAHIQDKK